MIGIVTQVHPHWLEQTLRYLVGALATVTLVAAANSAMLGLSRLAYSLSTNRQIPSGLGRLHPAALDAVRADHPRGPDRGGAGGAREPRLPRRDLRLRGDARVHDRAPVDLPSALHRARARPPLPGAAVGAGCAAASCRCRRRSGRCVCGAGWVAVMVLHEPARYVGLGWMAVGIAAVRRLPPRG